MHFHARSQRLGLLIISLIPRPLAVLLGMRLRSPQASQLYAYHQAKLRLRSRQRSTVAEVDMQYLKDICILSSCFSTIWL